MVAAETANENGAAESLDRFGLIAKIKTSAPSCQTARPQLLGAAALVGRRWIGSRGLPEFDQKPLLIPVFPPGTGPRADGIPATRNLTTIHKLEPFRAPNRPRVDAERG